MEDNLSMSLFPEDAEKHQMEQGHRYVVFHNLLFRRSILRHFGRVKVSIFVEFGQKQLSVHLRVSIHLSSFDVQKVKWTNIFCLFLLCVQVPAVNLCNLNSTNKNQSRTSNNIFHIVQVCLYFSNESSYCRLNCYPSCGLSKEEWPGRSAMVPPS